MFLLNYVVIAYLSIDCFVSASLKYVRETSGYDDCEFRCELEPSCVKWSSYKLTSDKSISCYLESVKMQRFRSLNSDLFSTDKVTLGDVGSVKYSHVSVQHLIKDPVPLDGSSILAIPQHFIKGCEYTISLWVWLWRGSNPYENSEIAIFRLFYQFLKIY